MKKILLSVLALLPLLIPAASRAADTDKLQADTAATNHLQPDLVMGKWRGLFAIKPGVEVPFHFQVERNGAVYLLNGNEKFTAGHFSIANDSLFIPFPLFENELALAYDGSQLSGVLRKQNLKGGTTLVKAQKGINDRFYETGSSPIKDITGTYDVEFGSAEGKKEKAVGIFQQKGHRVTATFLRVTGDSRFLEGTIEDNQLQLSSFIGSSPSYYKATVLADGSLKGENINARSSTPFTASLNPDAALPDAYSLTKLKEESNRIFQFSFPDANGNIISSSDKRFAGKPLIVTIGGTWCPNCMDEANFLGAWYEKNKNRGIEVVALQYERQTDTAFIKKAFDRFSKRYNIQYPLLVGGVADKLVVVETLPALQNFISFPTTVFIDKTGKVSKIHTGFSGPATGKYYEDFIKTFNEEADKLLQ